MTEEHPLIRAARADAFAGLLNQAFKPEHCELERETAIENRIHAGLKGIELPEEQYNATPMNPFWCAACSGYPVEHTCFHAEVTARHADDEPF